jgi:hypothetical protein
MCASTSRHDLHVMLVHMFSKVVLVYMFSRLWQQPVLYVVRMELAHAIHTRRSPRLWNRTCDWCCVTAFVTGGLLLCRVHHRQEVDGACEAPEHGIHPGLHLLPHLRRCLQLAYQNLVHTALFPGLLTRCVLTVSHHVPLRLPLILSHQQWNHVACAVPRSALLSRRVLW